MKVSAIIATILLISGLLLMSCAGDTGRNAAIPAGQTNSPPVAAAWTPPPPPEDGFDWIQLKSGEWLKGQLKAMQDRELEFDSEELELQTFDWKDIFQVRSPHINDLLFDNQEKATGPVSITQEQVTVGGPEPRTYPRSQLQSITPGGSKERNYWSGKASLGLTLRSGNTDEVEYNASAHLNRRTPATRFKFEYLGSLSRTDGVESTNNERVNTEFDLWLSRRFYLITPSGEYFRDPFQNISHRATIGLGVGYYLIDRPDLEWYITTGPGYQQTRFSSVQPGEAETKDEVALQFTSQLDWEITRRTDLILQYQGQYTGGESGGTLQHSVSTLDIELSKVFDLNISFVWDRNSNPEAGAGGIKPKKDDIRTIVGLGVDF